MFSFFKKKETGPQISDEVWRSNGNLLEGLYRQWQQDPSLLVLCWFADRLEETETFFRDRGAQGVNLCMTRDYAAAKYPDNAVILLGHYPLPEKEAQFFATIHTDTIRIWSALDEPLFLHFGGQKIIALLDSMGMKPDEMIRNSMLTKAIHGAQEKIASKVTIEQHADTAADWIRMNLGS